VAVLVVRLALVGHQVVGGVVFLPIMAAQQRKVMPVEHRLPIRVVVGVAVAAAQVLLVELLRQVVLVVLVLLVRFREVALRMLLAVAVLLETRAHLQEEKLL
jgi:hypothetical protein